jgi:DNA-binding response OmpR family regulator
MPNSTRPQILVIDDDNDARALTQTALAREEYDVTPAISTEDALRKLSILSFDVAIVDLRLPGLDGIHLLREIHRRWPDTVTIVLTAFPTFDSSIAALRAGAYDYFTKPCPPAELRRAVQEGLAKRQGLLKRLELMRALEEQLTQGLRALRKEELAPSRGLTNPAGDSLVGGNIIRAASFIIDRDQHQAMLGDILLDLTPTEFEILALLVERAPTLVSAQELVRRGLNYDVTEIEARDIIRWHIHHLRRKLEIDPDQPDLLKNVRGIGYRIDIS